MIEPLPGTAFIHKYFSPENRLAEVICAVVMVLSFTAATSGTFEETTPHALLIAILGCNIAWGIVDGATYVMGNMLNRGARARLITALKSNPHDPEAASILTARLDTALGPVLTPAQLDQLREWIVQGAARVEPEPAGLRKSDIYTGIACFVTVLAATVPLLLPFLLIEKEKLALRVSHGVMLVMLFGVGWRWARMVGISGIKMGFTLLGIGVVLVVITVFLGG